MANRSKSTYVLWVLFGINMMNFFDRQILAAVTEPIRMEWHLNDSALGWLNTAFVLLYAAVGVPLGRLSDRWLRTRILAIGVSIWSLFTAASGLAWNYWSLFAVRLGVGVGEASCAPAANSLIGDIFPPQKRARAISIFMLGLPIGIFTSNLSSGIIAKQYGWRVTFFIACIPGLILAALALRIKEPHRGGAEEHHVVGHEQEGSPYWRVLRIPTIWWIILSGALHNFNAYAVNAFLPAFLGRYHGMDLRQANTIAAIVLGAVGVVGLLGGGWAADKFRQTRANGRMLLATASLFVSTPLVYLALDRPKGDLVGFMLLMGSGWMLIYVYYATVYAAIQDVVEPGLRATAMALYFFAMYVLGGSFGTSILGMLSDHYAKKAMIVEGVTVLTETARAEGLHSAFYVVPLVSLLLAIVLYAGSRTIAKDMEKLQKWMRESAAKPPATSAADTTGITSVDGNDHKQLGKKLPLGVAGVLIGGVIGFVMRPSVPLIGQLDFATVMTRGSNLSGLDTLLVDTAQTSFNYLVLGMILGGIAGAGAAYVLSTRAGEPSRDQFSRAQGTPVPPDLKSPSDGDGITERIQKLSELKDKGILTEEEFQTKKTELLGRL